MPGVPPVVEVDEKTPEQEALIAMLREVSKVFGAHDIIEEYVACKCFPVREGWSISSWAAEEKWARKAIDNGADGLIAVNSRAGGHAGRLAAEPLIDMLRPLGHPVVAAGGVGDEREFVRLLGLGYDGVQLGTRFIATAECRAHQSYKDALVQATGDDIVLTERVTGVPLAVINTPYVQRIGTRAGPLARMMLKGRRTKHLMRTLYAVRSAMRLKQASLHGGSSSDYWQAGKSVDGIQAIESAADIVRRYGAAAGF